MRGGQRGRPGPTPQKEPRTQAKVRGEEKGIGRPVEKKRGRQGKDKSKNSTVSKDPPQHLPLS